MTKSLLFALQGFAVILLFIQLGDRLLPVPRTATSLSTALETVTTRFHTDLDACAQAIDRYAALAADEQSSVADLQRQHLATRLAFKRAEYLLCYLDATAIVRYLNGAPLPKLVPNVPSIEIIEPSGLQVLDELAFAELPDRAEMQAQLAQLQHAYAGIRTYQSNIRLQHRYVFDAAYLEIVRVFTLGLTGFDTPGSVNALPEAAAALERLQFAFAQYAASLSTHDAELARGINDRFATALRTLRAGDFATFDRLSFLRDQLDPLRRELEQARRALGIEGLAKVGIQPIPFNYAAESLFSADFLNVDFYTGYDDSPYHAERVALGKLLFFDPVLSRNNERSCASCHQPERAFTDGRSKSLAIDGQGHIQRNSPGLINVVYAERFFHDLREEQLERQIKHVVLDSLEFGTNFLTIVDKLSQSAEYRELFARAYPDQPRYQLSKWSLSDALARYVASLRTQDSPFDRYARRETEELSPAARRGFNLFMGKAVCGTCHFAPTFAGLVPPLYRENESEVLGVPVHADTADLTLDPDLGRYASARPQDEAYFYAYSFKTPTVRNVALTAPYMHNGAYPDLAGVVDFYNRGGGAGMGIDLEHQTLPFSELDLTFAEMADIVTFMESLTDTTGLTDYPLRLPRFEHQPAWNARVVGGRY